MKNVPPSEKLRKEIDEILSGQLGKDEDLLGLMIDRSLKMMFQKILEQEVKDYLGRDYYERDAGSRKGYRNGYEPTHHACQISSTMSAHAFRWSRSQWV